MDEKSASIFMIQIITGEDLIPVTDPTLNDLGSALKNKEFAGNVIQQHSHNNICGKCGRGLHPATDQDGLQAQTNHKTDPGPGQKEQHLDKPHMSSGLEDKKSIEQITKKIGNHETDGVTDSRTPDTRTFGNLRDLEP